MQKKAIKRRHHDLAASTGNLDSTTSQDVLGLMKVTNQKFGQKRRSIKAMPTAHQCGIQQETTNGFLLFFFLA